MNRLVYCQDPLLDTREMVNQEHGFFGVRGKTKRDNDFYHDLTELIVPIFKCHNYDFSGPLQDDCSVVFFIDKSNGTFGLFYRCAERFVCPIEKFISLEYEFSGHFKNSYLLNPTDFILNINFLNNENKNDRVTIKLTAKREYIRKSSILFIFSSRYEEIESMISERTMKTFEIIKDRITKEKNELKENMPEIDIEEKNKIAEENEILYRNKLQECIKKYIGSLK